MINRLCFISLITLVTLSCKSVIKPWSSRNYKIQYHFPHDWIGHYQGELMIFSARDTQLVDMQLIIENPDSYGFYPWTIIYNEEDIRAYGLEAINVENGHYRIDEYNGIKLDAFYRAGHLISNFEVLGSVLLVDYYKSTEGIHVSFYITNTEVLDVHYEQGVSEDTIPTVKTYRLNSFQKVLLKPANS